MNNPKEFVKRRRTEMSDIEKGEIKSHILPMPSRLYCDGARIPSDRTTKQLFQQKPKASKGIFNNSREEFS